MTGSVPPILWYLLCVVAFAIFPLAMVATIHRHRMKVLEILRCYAEKGVDPPAAVTELLMKQIAEPQQKWNSTARGSRLHTFGIHLFIACLFGAVAWWRLDAGDVPIVFYVAVASAVFFGVSALGQLAVAIASPDR
jgi:hypothetical protein